MTLSVDNLTVTCFQFCLRQWESSWFLKGLVTQLLELLTNISIAFPIFPAVPLFGSQELFKSKQCTIVGFEVKMGENSPFYGKMEEKLVGGNQEPHDTWHKSHMTSWLHQFSGRSALESMLGEVRISKLVPIKLSACFKKSYNKQDGTLGKVFVCTSLKTCSTLSKHWAKSSMFLRTSKGRIKGILRMAFKIVGWISLLWSRCTLLF